MTRNCSVVREIQPEPNLVHGNYYYGMQTVRTFELTECTIFIDGTI